MTGQGRRVGVRQSTFESEGEHEQRLGGRWVKREDDFGVWAMVPGRAPIVTEQLEGKSDVHE